MATQLGNGKLRAGERPAFGYDGALELARMLYDTATTLTTSAKRRAKPRDEALAKWKGVEGDNFGDRASNEDESATNVVSDLKSNGDSWASLWAETVDEQNRVLQAEAWERYKDDVKRRKAEQESNLDKIGTFLGLRGEDTALDDIPMPDPVPVPRGPAFVEQRSKFAHYHFDGDNVRITYRDNPPPVYL